MCTWTKTTEDSAGGAINEVILVIGDSKSAASNSWPETLVSSLNAATPGTHNWSAIEKGIGSTTTQNWVDTHLAAMMATIIDIPTRIAINLTVNDFGITTEPTWITNIQSIIATIHARWPNALFYISKPDKRDFAAAAAARAVSVDTVVASNPTYILVGDDETDWFENGDDFTTYSDDGVHYNSSGNAAKAAAMQSALGFA